MQHQTVPDQHNDNIEIGRFLHKNSYKRHKKEIQLGNAKFDFIEKKGSQYIVGEIKKSSKYEEASKMQLAYYLYLLQQQGIKAQGELRIPKEKKVIKLTLDKELITKIQQTEKEIQIILEQPVPPKPVKINFCKNCAYKEFCWS